MQQHIKCTPTRETLPLPLYNCEMDDYINSCNKETYASHINDVYIQYDILMNVKDKSLFQKARHSTNIRKDNFYNTCILQISLICSYCLSGLLKENNEKNNVNYNRREVL